jgi:hypothetical protein
MDIGELKSVLLHLAVLYSKEHSTQIMPEKNFGYRLGNKVYLNFYWDDDVHSTHCIGYIYVVDNQKILITDSMKSIEFDDCILDFKKKLEDIARRKAA